MGEISDPYAKMKKLKKKLGEIEPGLFEKKEIGILEGPAHKKKKRGKGRE